MAGALAAADENMIAPRLQFGHRHDAIEGNCLPYLQILSAKLRIRSGPGLKATHPVQDLGCST